MKNYRTFFEMRSSLRVSFKLLIALLISFSYLHHSKAQGYAWYTTVPPYPSNGVYELCPTDTILAFYFDAAPTMDVYDCGGYPQTATLDGIYVNFSGTPSTGLQYNAGAGYYYIDPSTLILGNSYTIEFYPVYSFYNCGMQNYTENGSGGFIDIYILNGTETPTVNIQSNGSLCSNGNAIFYTGNLTLAGNNPTFNWQKNGVNIPGQTSSTYTANNLAAGDVITLQMTSSHTCLNNPTVVSNSFTITNPLTPSLTISSNPSVGSNICPNTNITFTANATNAGSNPMYYWARNGVSISNYTYNNTFTYSSNSLQPTDVITCTMNTGNTCVTNSSYIASTNSLTFSNLQPKARVIFPTGATSVCMNGSTQLSVNNVNGTSTYIWQKLQNNVWSTIAGATGSSYTTPPLTATTYYRYIRNNSLCGLDTSYSADITIKNVSLSYYPVSTTVCENTSVNYTSNTSSQLQTIGGTYSYQWQQYTGGIWTNIAGATAQNYSTMPLSVTTAFRSVATFSNAASNCSVTSPTYNVTVKPAPNLVVSPSSAAYCGSGGSQIFVASGANTYSWSPSVGLSGTNSASTTASPTSSQNYTLTGTGTNGCSKNIQVGVDVLSSPGFTVAINSDKGNTICTNTSVVFSPQFTPAGYAFSSYQYEWKKNGVIVATTPTYTTSSLVNGDVMNLKVTSPLTCQSTNPFYAAPYTMNVQNSPNLNPISLAISSPLGSNICNNAAVTFTATATNAGLNPVYQWKKNGINIGTNTPSLVFTNTNGTNGLANNDVISCQMTSTPLCSTQVVTIANTLNLTILNSGSGLLSISSSNGNINCSNTPITFTANPYYSIYVNPTLQWKKNGVAIAGATNTTYTTSTLVNGDVITCEMITNNTCKPVITSNSINMIISSGGITPTLSISQLGGANCGDYTYLKATCNLGTNLPFQWRLNGVNISSSSATNATYYPTQYGTYSCIINASLSCITSNTITSNNLNADASHDAGATIYISSPSAGVEVCEGDMVYVYAEAGYCDDCGCNYNYMYMNGVGGVDNSSGSFGSYSYVAGDGWFDNAEAYLDPCIYGAGNCDSYALTATIADPIIFPVNFMPSVTITASNVTTCGAFPIYTATPVGGGNASYQWKVNGVSVVGATNATFSANALQNGGIITCDMTSSLACAATPTVSSNALIISGSMATLSLAASSICAGGTVNVNLTGGNAGATYTWQVSTNNGTTWSNITGYVNTTNISFSNIPGSSRSYRVIVNDPICGVYTTPSVALTLVADPVLTVTPSNNNFCAGGNTTLSTTVAGGLGTNSYQWQQYIGTTWTNIAGATSASYTASNVSATTNYRANLTQSVSGCAASLISAITVKPLPNITTNPALPKYCVGGTVSISAAGGSNYSWSPATGLSVVTGSPVVASGTISTTYSLTGTGTNGCTKTIAVPVTVNQDPGIVVTGASSVCVGSSATLTANTTGGAGTCTIQWQKSTNGTTWSSISGATGATYTTPAMTANAYYRATYTCNGGGCSPAAASSSLLVSVVNLQPVLSLAQATICTGGTAVVNLTGGNAATTYTWQVSTNSGATWTNITGYVNTTSTTFSHVPGTSRSYQVIANDPACGIITTAAANITLISDPVLTVTPSNNNFCAGGNTTLSTAVTGGLGTNSYQWQQYIGTTWTNIAGATGASYTGTNLSATTSYRANLIQSVSGCGASTISAITVKTLPNITTSPAAPTYCVGGTVSISAAGGSNYSWSPATGLSAATGSPVIASGTTSTTYSLTGTGTNGCTKTISVPVIVKADPSITVTGPTSVPTGTGANLSATTNGGSGTCTLQWQSSTNGTTWSSISGATAATYTTPAITGTKYYRATYTCNGSGCSPAGTSNVLTIIGIQPPTRLAEKVYDLTLYPNPASVNLTVSLSTTADENADFIITDMLGKTLTQWEGKAENGVYENEISIENLSQGVYFLSVKIGERVMTQKFVKE